MTLLRIFVALSKTISMRIGAGGNTFTELVISGGM